MPAQRIPLAVHLDPLTLPERALWDRYLELVSGAGESELISTKSGIAFRAPHSRFTGAFFKSHRLELWFDLPQPVAEKERDERFREVWQHSRTKWVHRLKIERPDELDRKLAGWLEQSWRAYAKSAADR
jgi:Lon protease-like protein